MDGGGVVRGRETIWHSMKRNNKKKKPSSHDDKGNKKKRCGGGNRRGIDTSVRCTGWPLFEPWIQGLKGEVDLYDLMYALQGVESIVVVLWGTWGGFEG